MAKLQRRKKPPEYADRVYDTSRAVPTALERKLYAKYLQVHLGGWGGGSDASCASGPGGGEGYR